MIRKTWLVALLGVAKVVGAQTAPTPVVVQPTTIFSYPIGTEQYESNLEGAPGGKLLYYRAGDTIRVYNRATKTSRDLLSGGYSYIAASPQGDRLVLLRLGEDAKPNSRPPRYVWTLPVNPATGAATGEPRRVSLIPAEAPRISPDGQQIAFIAAGTSRKMMVIPSAGGPERVVFDGGAPHGPVQWSPDGKWIYFVQSSGKSEAQTIVSRVAVAGGTPAPVTPAVDTALMGLAPDGRSIVARTSLTGNGMTLGIFDTLRTLVRTVSVPFHFQTGFPTELAWAGDGMRAISSFYVMSLSVHAQSIDGSQARTLPFTDAIRNPTLSPNGKRIAFAETGDAGNWQVSVMNADGTARRVVQSIDQDDLVEAEWSPDGNYIAYPSKKALYVANAATGKAVKVGSGPLGANVSAWRADSRAVFFARYEGTDTTMRVSIHEATVDGVDRLIRDITSELPSHADAWYGYTYVVNDSQALVLKRGLVVSIKGGPTRQLYEPIKVRGSLDPAMSADGTWIAVPASDRKSVEIVTMDGKSRQTLRLPSGATLRSVAMRQPSKGPLIVNTAGAATTAAAIYALPLDGGVPRALTTLPIGQEFNDFTVSSDQKTVVYANTGATTMKIVDLDLGAARPAARKP
ncbi:MAG: hypothetical protein ABJB74_19890 [Gemmatimonas sp.]